MEGNGNFFSEAGEDLHSLQPRSLFSLLTPTPRPIAPLFAFE
jgi:hypothetical protein